MKICLHLQILHWGEYLLADYYRPPRWKWSVSGVVCVVLTHLLGVNSEEKWLDSVFFWSTFIPYLEPSMDQFRPESAAQYSLFPDCKILVNFWTTYLDSTVKPSISTLIKVLSSSAKKFFIFPKRVHNILYNKQRKEVCLSL